MADNSKIEWTEATWNPVTGCSVVSPGCTNCYAMGLAGTRLRHHPSRAVLTKESKAGPVWTGEVRLNEDWLDQPLRWSRPRRIFVCAHGDLFHENVPDWWIYLVLATMAMSYDVASTDERNVVSGYRQRHTYQVLTKRAGRMQRLLSELHETGRQATDGDRWIGHRFSRAAQVISQRKGDPVWQNASLTAWQWVWDGCPGLWLGVSAEDQVRADERIPLLLETPAAVRWVSAEPLLGPVGLTPWLGRLDWVVAGGESGRDARPMHPDWARALRDQCAGAGVPFFFKQWGEWLPWAPEHGPCWVAQNGLSEDHHVLFPADMDGDRRWDDGLWAVSEGAEHFAFQRVGKKAAGALLDGVAHRAYPA